MGGGDFAHFVPLCLSASDRHMESVLGITLESVPPTRARGDSRESETQAKRKQKREALLQTWKCATRPNSQKGERRRGREGKYFSCVRVQYLRQSIPGSNSSGLSIFCSPHGRWGSSRSRQEIGGWGLFRLISQIKVCFP